MYGQFQDIDTKAEFASHDKTSLDNFIACFFNQSKSKLSTGWREPTASAEKTFSVWVAGYREFLGAIKSIISQKMSRFSNGDLVSLNSC